MPRLPLGEFLIAAGLVSREQVEEALAIQRENHLLIGALAVHAGRLTHIQVHQVLARQRTHEESFGAAAAALGFGSTDMFDTLSTQQRDAIPLIGHTLVLLGYLDEPQLATALRDYAG